jgi:Asp/Glu/hydantoin racemase
MTLLAVIRVFTAADPEVLAAHSRIIGSRFGLDTRTYCIPDQPLGIYDDASERLAVPKIVAAARQAAADGARAILVSCAADPAVDECRRQLTVPVIGAGTASAGISLALGRKIGVLTLNGPVPQPMAQALGPHLAAAMSPTGVATTADLLAPAGRDAAVAAARALAGLTDVVAFACTGYTTIGLAALLRGALPVPVVDAVEAGGLAAFHLLGGTPRA